MKKILFLCTGNSCRSQMAEGLANSLLGPDFRAYSAGTEPGTLDSRAVRVMAEAGIDISGARPKHVSEFKGADPDIVVTLCDKARESCPIWAGRARKLHRGFEDPPFLARTAGTEEEALAHYRRVRDEIREFVLGLPEPDGLGVYGAAARIGGGIMDFDEKRLGASLPPMGRWGILALGWLVIVIGIIMIPAPGPGILVILAGTIVLSLESPLARWLVTRLKNFIRRKWPPLYTLLQKFQNSVRALKKRRK